MNRRHLIRTLALTGLLAAACFSGNARAGTDKQEPIRVGERLRFDSELRIDFLKVRDDSRCPINAKCVSAGDAEVVLRIKAGNQPAKNYRLHTNDNPRRLVIPANVFPPDTGGIPKSYVIRIATLNPLPYAGKPTKQSDYRLGLHISVAQ
ncbi:MAG: hypothetical protein V4689_16065 [Verrucomicrobiota bacterium]